LPQDQCLSEQAIAGARLKCTKHGVKEMDILKYVCNEICCFIKSSFDITIQKIQQILNL